MTILCHTMSATAPCVRVRMSLLHCQYSLYPHCRCPCSQPVCVRLFPTLCLQDSPKDSAYWKADILCEAIKCRSSCLIDMGEGGGK
jgi:hypothetical protein